jgi:hypothetical protein
MGGSIWPDEHIDLLKRAVLEKEMPISALLKLFPGKSAASIRSQLRRQDLPVISENICVPNMDFFESYGQRGTPELKVV